ncbi:2Fe-2S iron-sulfur cluster binding domain-containing protein [Rhizobium leguminosarum]|uniref:2Fe-2S iron-sulfur cluster binding domain-containing protein n=1 Tax=Rhizobium leguminosarum TaxID=384 RepID=UPI0010317596|nr:2Fe-2S iron-sulfur cluster binding domain-containing protein [Rhizobium leguminosarum]TAZ44379.1 2Fe-2S iron-sulfur cluster binding domain-containing protein [Rhizobium leguminosarum]
MRKKKFTITVDDLEFAARPGEILLDAAVASGVELPHDCRVGHCGTCTVEVRGGTTFGGETGQRDRVRACQAHVFSNLDIAVEKTPNPAQITGRITEIHEVAEGIVEVTIAPNRRFEFLPGQYCRLQFRGFPKRNFSPTACMSSARFGYNLKFHIKRVRSGQVTPFLGSRIRTGHQVRIEGPFGVAYHRSGRANRLVLAGSGTGFAPIWAIVSAALSESPGREIVLVCGTREYHSFYMAKALEFAAKHKRVSVIPTLEQLPRKSKLLAEGTPAHHIPELTENDIVYAAGSPKMVSHVAAMAKVAGADFYADPFEASTSAEGSLERFGRLLDQLKAAATSLLPNVA